MQKRIYQIVNLAYVGYVAACPCKRCTAWHAPQIVRSRRGAVSRAQPSALSSETQSRPYRRPKRRTGQQPLAGQQRNASGVIGRIPLRASQPINLKRGFIPQPSGLRHDGAHMLHRYARLWIVSLFEMINMGSNAPY